MIASPDIEQDVLLPEPGNRSLETIGTRKQIVRIPEDAVVEVLQVS
jgi:hypothetical protein